MFTTLITTVTGVCLLFVGVLIVIAAVEKRMEKEKARLLESFDEFIHRDRATRNTNRQVRMSQLTMMKMSPEVTIGGGEYPQIGRYEEYEILDAPNAELGAFFF